MTHVYRTFTYITLVCVLITTPILTSAQSLTRTQSLRCALQPVLFFLTTPSYCTQQTEVPPIEVGVQEEPQVTSPNTEPTTGSPVQATVTQPQPPQSPTSDTNITALVNLLVDFKLKDIYSRLNNQQPTTTYVETGGGVSYNTLQAQADAISRSSATALNDTLTKGTADISASSVNVATATIQTLASSGGTLNINGNISNLTLQGLSSSLREVGSVSTGGDSYTVFVQGQYAYIANFSGAFQIFDVSNPASPVLMSSLTTNSGAVGLYVSGGYAYKTDFGAQVSIIDISNKKNPIQISTANSGFCTRTMAVQGPYAYHDSQCWFNGIGISDISNPYQITPKGFSQPGSESNATGITVNGKYMYVTYMSGTNTFKIVDVSDPNTPVTVSEMAIGSPTAVGVQGNYAYITVGSTLKVIDVSNPTSPTLVKTITTGGVNEHNISISGRYLTFATTNGKVEVYDISNPLNPTLAGQASGLDAGRSAYVVGRYVYVADSGSQKLRIFDLGGAEFTAATVASLSTGNVDVLGGITTQGNVSFGSGLNVGLGGIFSAGQISASKASSTAANGIAGIFTGSVGIGTVIPAALLDLKGFASDATVPLFNVASSTGTSLFRISANGNVGIGTTTPSVKLSIAGTTDLNGLNTSGGSFWGNASSSVLSFYAGTDYSQGAYFNVFGNNAGNSSQRGNVEFVIPSTSGFKLYGYNSGISQWKERFGVTGDGMVHIGGRRNSYDTQMDRVNYLAALTVTSQDVATTTLALFPANGQTANILNLYTTGGSFGAPVLGSVITADHNLGLGTTTPNQKLVVAGTIQSTALLGGATTLSTDASGNIIRTPSDQRLKENILPIVSALDKVSRLQGVTFDWIDKNRFGTQTEIGLIAQQVEQVVPEVVLSGGDYKSVNYPNLVALLIEAVKEIKTTIDLFAKNIKTELLSADKVQTKELCIDDVCVTKEQLLQVLQGSNTVSTPTQTPVVPIPTTETGTPSSEPESTQEETPDAPTEVVEPVAEPVVEAVPPTEEPTPAPEPSPEPAA